MDNHCWAVESKVRLQLSPRMKEIGKVLGTETIAFQTVIIEEVIAWMSEVSFDERGGLKRFTIFQYDSIGKVL